MAKSSHKATAQHPVSSRSMHLTADVRRVIVLHMFSEPVFQKVSCALDQYRIKVHLHHGGIVPRHDRGSCGIVDYILS